MQNALCRGLDNAPEVKSFIVGSCLASGTKHQEDIEEPFQQTGTIHLFAVAGLRRWMHSSYEWLCGGAAVSLAAWIGSLPLILWYFHLVTPISFLANLVVVPIAFFVLAVALLSLITTPLLPWIAIVFNNANWTLSTLVIGIVHLFAQIPGGHFYVGEPDWGGRTSAKVTGPDLGAGAAVHVRVNGRDWLIDCGGANALTSASCASICTGPA